MSSGDAAAGLFDKEAALKRLGGSVELLKDMFQFFIEDAPVLLETLKTSLANDDIEEAYRAAHSLKGLASNFDAHAVTGPAKRIEEFLRQNDIESARPLAAEIERGVYSCIAIGKKILNHPGGPSVETSRQ